MHLPAMFVDANANAKAVGSSRKDEQVLPAAAYRYYILLTSSNPLAFPLLVPQKQTITGTKGNDSDDDNDKII